jgi:energy-coupling factor transporter transmembrane protein EcfT
MIRAALQDAKISSSSAHQHAIIALITWIVLHASRAGTWYLRVLGSLSLLDCLAWLTFAISGWQPGSSLVVFRFPLGEDCDNAASQSITPRMVFSISFQPDAAGLSLERGSSV